MPEYARSLIPNDCYNHLGHLPHSIDVHILQEKKMSSKASHTIVIPHLAVTACIHCSLPNLILFNLSILFCLDSSSLAIVIAGLVRVRIFHEDQLVDERHIMRLVVSQDVPNLLCFLVIHLVTQHVAIIIITATTVRLQKGVGFLESGLSQGLQATLLKSNNSVAQPTSRRRGVNQMLKAALTHIQV